MPAPNIVEVREYGSGGSSTGGTMTLSSAAKAGMLVVVSHANDWGVIGDLRSPTGGGPGAWTLINEGNAGTNNSHIKLWYKVLQADGPHTVNTVQVASNYNNGSATVIANHNGIDRTTSAGYSAAHVNPWMDGPSVNVPVHNMLHLSGYCIKPDINIVNILKTGATAHSKVGVGGLMCGIAVNWPSPPLGSTGLIPINLNKNKNNGASVSFLVTPLPVYAGAVATGRAEISASARRVARASAVLRATGTIDATANVKQRGAATVEARAEVTSAAEIKRVAATGQISASATLEPTRATFVISAAGTVTGEVRLWEKQFGTPYRPPAYPMYVPQEQNTQRVIAEEILSGEWVSWDVPLGQISYTRQLCGPTVITGIFAPGTPDLAALGLESGATWIHLEKDGRIQCSGILQPMSLSSSGVDAEAEGFSSYAHEIPYDDEWTLRGAGGVVGVDVDPTDVVRECWRHIQSYPDGNLGVTVDGTKSPVRMGEPERDVSFETGTGEQVDFTAGPYRLDYWENTMCGSEIDKLAVETPFEYREKDYWNADKTKVLHHLEIAYPRIGRRRDDLHFEQGLNITSELAFPEDADYASHVIFTGRGEGRAKVRGSALTRRGKRLRKVALVNDKSVGSKRRADAIAADALGKMSPIIEFKTIMVLMDHVDAPMGSYDVGDDIYVQGELPYIGEVGLWHRIVTYKPDFVSGQIELGLLRTDRFIYGPMGQAAMATLNEEGEWIMPNSIEGRGTGSGMRRRDENGNWVEL